MERYLADVVDEIPPGRGLVGLLSGDEFLPHAEAFDRAVLQAAGPRVALLLCADPPAAPRQASLGLRYFRGLGAKPFVLDVLERADALSAELPPYDVLFVGGGSPSALLACLHGTPLWDAIVERWRGGAGVVGSSAGAMALCAWCLEPLRGADRPTVWSRGLGLLRRFALAVHARTRPRSWLEEVAATAPVPVVALEDEAGLLLRPSSAPQVIGGGRAWVVC